MNRLHANECGHEIIENEFGRFAIARVGKRFMVAKWNSHHGNWVRENREEGGGVHRDLDVLSADNLGGGPVTMTLQQARECVEMGFTTPQEIVS